MEIFKIGDVVYDEVNTPNMKGKVINDKFNAVNYPIRVEWSNGARNLYTLDGRILLSRIPTLSYTPYTIEFKGFSQERPLTDEQKVCIKEDGTSEHGEKIILYLEKLGGYSCGAGGYTISGLTYYFIDETTKYIINSTDIPEGYKEISLKEVEPHICKHCEAETTQPDSECYKAPINYVGKKIVIDDDTCLIVSQNKVRIETSKYLIKLENIHKYEIID